MFALHQLYDSIALSPLYDYFDGIVIFDDNSKSIYQPKRRGRKSNRYKHYFRARTTPNPAKNLRMYNALKGIVDTKWSDKKIEREPLLMFVDGECRIKYRPSAFC